MLHIRLIDPARMASLCEFIAGAGGLAQRTSDPHVVAISLPGADSPAQEQREVANYLATWRELRDGCPTEIVGRPPRG